MNKFQSNSKCAMWCMALLLSILATGCDRDPILGLDVIQADSTRPRVTATVPANLATGVAINTAITATFSEDMDPATLTGTSFTVRGPGATPVAGTVSYPFDSRTAKFTPAANLPINTLFTATITTGATDLVGNALAGNQPPPLPAASNYVWTFTTGATADNTPPTVISTIPANLATGVCLQRSVGATFSEPMDPATINTTTLTLRVSGPPLGPVLAGFVTYDVPNRVATLNPNADLLANTNYTATATTGVRDLAGNAMAANRVWTFTTGTVVSCSPPAPNPGSAGRFGVFGGSAGMTNTGIQTVINGDIGTIATGTSAVTGFHDALDVYTETPVNIGTVNGRIFTCTNSTTGPASTGPIAANCALATQARLDAQAMYIALQGLPPGANPGQNLAGQTLAPGVYTAGDFLIQGANLTLDAQGDANARWVFQIATTLTVGGPGAAAPQSIVLTGGAQSKNIFWAVGTFATINAAGGGTMEGTIISQAGASFSTAGNTAIVTLNGRVQSLVGSVTLVNTVINVPAP